MLRAQLCRAHGLQHPRGHQLLHLLNDMMQSLLPALYPMLRSSYQLSFTQIGLLTFTFQFTASLLQPLVGHSPTRVPAPIHSPPAWVSRWWGWCCSPLPTATRCCCSRPHHRHRLFVFHPNPHAWRRMASGGSTAWRNRCSRLAVTLVPRRARCWRPSSCCPAAQSSVAWFSGAALLGIVVLINVGHWYKTHGITRLAHAAGSQASRAPRRHVVLAIAVLLALVFSSTSTSRASRAITLLSHRPLSRFGAQFAAAAVRVPGRRRGGGMAGGPLGDRLGSKYIIWPRSWVSCRSPPAAARESLLDVCAHRADRLIISSRFRRSCVRAGPAAGRTGMVAGLFFGLAFGMGSVGAAVLGKLADHSGIDFVYQVCAFLPLIGLLAAFLPMFTSSTCHERVDMLAA